MAAKAMLTLIWPEAASLLQPINKSLRPTALQKILSKSRFNEQVTDYHSLLVQRFGQITGDDLPLAALRFPGETALCADLCYLHADRDCLRLFHHDLQVTDDEANELQMHLRPLLEEFQGDWLTYSAKHWGLRLPALPNVKWQAIDALEGQSISEKMPVGSEQNNWRRLLNEIQMSLFEHPVNQQREAAGLLPINAVWFSGAATLDINAQWQYVAGDDGLLQQLAKHSGRDWLSSADKLLNNKSSGHSLIVMPAFDTDGDWSDQLQSLEQQFFKPLWQQLRHWRLSELNLCVPQLGIYQLTCWRSWL